MQSRLAGGTAVEIINASAGRPPAIFRITANVTSYACSDIPMISLSMVCWCSHMSVQGSARWATSSFSAKWRTQSFSAPITWNPLKQKMLLYGKGEWQNIEGQRWRNSNKNKIWGLEGGGLGIWGRGEDCPKKAVCLGKFHYNQKSDNLRILFVRSFGG